ncbi:hypothetical protein J2Z83_002946 [Virgibacillus natechei]|uniref:Uncharacterized protein n=1 Tax=Virgibacillus natechei TaxID=1216297 RepID=A0ABS4IIM3_9BACI|nr:hypothetical protein [Virgibacillus natechei]
MFRHSRDFFVNTEQSKTAFHVKTKELLNTIDRASLLAKEERSIGEIAYFVSRFLSGILGSGFVLSCNEYST